MRRIQRVLRIDDFLKSLENLEVKKFSDSKQISRGVIHLMEKMNHEFLPQVTKHIHEMNQSKEFERFLHEVFKKIPNCVPTMNGFGWGRFQTSSE